ncbi:hypothetical protein L6164_000469 [Bauhinia variegata]|uniref:Uncharacterized protein n=1 Tax=Bauhinia variegata TaxID=167791 RepID=A0ACB9Q8U0_BAUVA|nr:hypothetical protein L6164_000469 [Bauhinia variegata]
MVLMQQEDTEEQNVNLPKSQALKSTNCDADREASDGFETASEAELGSDGDDDGGENEQKEHPLQQQDSRGEREHKQQQRLERSVPQEKGDSSGDASNNEDMIQNALSQANEAKLEGNKLFADGKYEEALSQYELALQITAEVPSSMEIRSICHSNRAVCFLKMGKYENTVKECTKALELNPVYVKALVRRGEAHDKLEHFEEAIADMKKILEIDPSNDQARKAIRRLEPLAAEKREKMKEEMMAKLKEMGNSVLGRFGMSVDNFKAVKDPNTGSYSVSFQS